MRQWRPLIRTVTRPGRWARYRAGWTAWNHLRAAAALAAAALLTVGVDVA